MNNSSDNPKSRSDPGTSSTGADATPAAPTDTSSTGAAPTHARTSSTDPGAPSTDAHDSSTGASGPPTHAYTPPTRDAPPTRVIVPSIRVTAALAAVMLVIGGVLGAAIGPGPSSSFAGVPIQRLLPTIAALVGVAHGSAGSPGAHSSAAGPPPVSAEPTPAAETSTRRRRRRRHHAGASATSSTSGQAEAASPTSTTPTRPTGPRTGTGKTTALPPASKVWLIELSGSSFTQATSQATAAPYIDTQAVHDGTLLSGWSALDAGTFAGDAALIAGSSPQLLDTIVQPPCPEASAGADSGSGSSTNAGPTGTSTGASAGSDTSTNCAAGTPGGLTAADEFLKATLPTITSTSSYRENGLVVITFASIATATASGLPTGAATATLTSQPPAGALLISPFVAKGAKSQATFDPTSPRQSLEQLLRR